ncbi:hypothetical protein KAW18_11535 [candidate division WOR-3 bacterium]|nr:hypothetical protein [candidate division WOR-3 bacterium]
MPSAAYKRRHHLLTIPCKRRDCMEAGAMMHLEPGGGPAKYRCERCGLVRRLMYRRAYAREDAPKLYFKDTKAVRDIATQAITFYHTLPIFDNKVISPDMPYSPDLRVAYTLGMDIDLVGDTIMNTRNISALSIALDIVREELDTFIPNSYSIQTSGNGIYVMIHHSLVTDHISEYMVLYNALIRILNSKIKEKTNLVKVDDLNDRSRVFKSIFSIHQYHPLIAIPLEYDVNIEKFDSSQFKLCNFDIKNYTDNEGNITNFYNRSLRSESGALLKRLHESDITHEHTKSYRKHTPTKTTQIGIPIEERRWDRRGDIDGVPYYHDLCGMTEVIGKDIFDQTERVKHFDEISCKLKR